MAGLIAGPREKNKKTPAGPPLRRRAARARRGGRRSVRKLGLQGRDPCLEGLVLLAGELGHLSHGLKLVAQHDIKIAQDPLSLSPEDSVELPSHALGDACGIIHEPRHIVEKTVRRLRHCSPPSDQGCALRQRMGTGPQARKIPDHPSPPSRAKLFRPPCPNARQDLRPPENPGALART